MCDGALLSQAWLNTCLPWEALNEFLVLLCLGVTFAFPIKLPLSQPMSFPALTLLILSLILLEWEWASGSVGLGCWLGLKHDNPEIKYYSFPIAYKC